MQLAAIAERPRSCASNERPIDSTRATCCAAEWPKPHASGSMATAKLLWNSCFSRPSMPLRFRIRTQAR